MLNKTIFSKILSIIILLGSSLCAAIPFTIDYEKYTLDNGLTVILHVDKSDPIVGIAIQYHVGSNRETPGRTGFAHLFEHMLFQESQHIGQDQFFKIIQNVGGTLIAGRRDHVNGGDFALGFCLGQGCQGLFKLARLGRSA